MTGDESYDGSERSPVDRDGARRTKNCYIHLLEWPFLVYGSKCDSSIETLQIADICPAVK